MLDFRVRLMKKTIIVPTILALFVFCSSTLWAEGKQSATADYPDDPGKWLVIPVPSKSNAVEYEEFFRKANWSEVEWAVSLNNNGKPVARRKSSRGDCEAPEKVTRIAIEGPARFSEPSACLEVDDGWLVAYNNGEFGSSLYWSSTDGSHRYQFSALWVNQFLVDSGTVYAAEGLSHLHTSRGSIITMKKESGIWREEIFLTLPDCGQAMAAVCPGEFVVVTATQLLLISKDRSAKVLLSKTGWQGLYPSSVVAVDERFIYVGMRQYVARFDLKKGGRQYDLLIPDRSMINEKTK